jgi:peptidoglycan hydrolase CwlO-like protein
MICLRRHRSQKTLSLRVGAWSPLVLGAVLALAVLLLLPFSSPAKGDSQSDALRQQLAQKQTALNQAWAELQALQKELDQLESQADAASLRLAELEAEIIQVDADISEAEEDLEGVRLQLEDRLVGIYKDGGSWSLRYLEVLLVEKSLASVLKHIDMVTELANQDRELFDQVGDYLKASQTNKELLQNKKTEQQEELDKLVSALEQVSAKRASFGTKYQSLKTQIVSLRAQIRQAEALEAAAAAAAAARVNDVDRAASAASKSVGTTIPTTRPSTTSTGYPTPPTSPAEIARQAAYIERRFFAYRDSVLTGQMVMDIWIKYDISPAMSLTVLNAESGMGSLKWGGRLVTEANNFGCIKYRKTTAWLQWPPPISHGKIKVGASYWMTFPSVSLGMEAWARCITYGVGRDCYRPLMRDGDWEAFADIYYGKNVPGKSKYLERLRWMYNVLKYHSRINGFNWY